MKSTGKRIVLGVTGGIAAYKAVELLRLLTGAGHDVRVIQTPASRKFIGEMSFQALSGHPVACDQFETTGESVFNHIDLATADLLLVAPATAGTIGKMAAGFADNLLQSTYLATVAPVVVCPAMNQGMWTHTAVQENISTLRRRGVTIIEPETGELACGELGAGRLADPEIIAVRVGEMLTAAGDSASTVSAAAVDLGAVKVLVTAGGTREPIDSVRYITNRSSGKMGFALAEAARDRGAGVTVIAANCDLARASGIRYVDVVTASELEEALVGEYTNCDVLLMTAAVSDYKVSGGRPKGKLERREKNDLQLVPTSDIVSNLEESNKSRVKVGFSAEFGEQNRERARRKMQAKGLGMIVFNDISRDDIGFETNDNEVTIMIPGREDIFVKKSSKRECAERILDQVVGLLD